MAAPENTDFHVGQRVEVSPRTWAGINKPGGIGTITKVHYSEGCIDCLDVSYLVMGGTDTRIDLDFCKPHEFLSRGRRNRRGITNMPPPVANKRQRCKAPDENEDNDDPPPLCDVKNEFPGGAIEITIDRPPYYKLSPLEKLTPRVVPKKKKKKNTKTATTAVTMVETASQSKTASQSNKSPAPVVRVSKKKTHVSKNKVAESDTAAGPPKRPASKKAMKKSAPSNNCTHSKKPRKKTKPATLPNLTAVKGIVRSKDLSLKPKTPRVSLAKGDAKVVPLQEVYNNELQSAKKFVSGLLAEKTRKKLVVKPVPSNEEESTMDPGRLDRFVWLFSELLRKRDGELATNQILGDVNHGTAHKDAPFTTLEVDVGLKHLSAQNKIMVCDDMVYSI